MDGFVSSAMNREILNLFAPIVYTGSQRITNPLPDKLAVVLPETRLAELPAVAMAKAETMEDARTPVLQN